MEKTIKQSDEEKKKALKEKNEAIERLYREKSLAYRKQVICRTCDQIFLDPVFLPCSNTICKSHIHDFKQSKCQFCLQNHSTLLNEVKLNENLNEMLKMSLLSYPNFNGRSRVWSRGPLFVNLRVSIYFF